MLFEVTLWSGQKIRLIAFDVVGARVLAADESGETVRRVEVVPGGRDA